MKKIVTITLNPAFDLHYYMDKFNAEKENYVTRAVCDAGGKGINLSRALNENKVENTAYVILGDENGAQFEEAIAADRINYVPLYTEGRIRENITIHPKDGRETRISLDSFSISSDTLARFEELLLPTLDADTIVAFTGRNPKGVEKAEVISFLKRIKATGAKLAVDSNSFTPDELVSICPWFIKPNEQEIAAFLGREISGVEEAAQSALELVKRGVSEEVMVSMGKHGSVWSDGKVTYKLSVPKISALSTIGAGDSTVAGYLAAHTRGMSKKDSLRLACAFGTAACMTEGSRPPRQTDVDEIYKDVAVE